MKKNQEKEEQILIVNIGMKKRNEEMKPIEILENIGKTAIINGAGDLAFESDKKQYIKQMIPCKIFKLTKGGMAFLIDEDGKTISVPPKNVTLFYKNSEWDFKLGDCGYFDYDENIYIDEDGKPITGILENFKYYNEGNLNNHQMVVDGKRDLK
jgi:hypothetical protein